ncbi:MAG: serine hydrolase domain-containing protein [Bacteroidota bacterium]
MNRLLLSFFGLILLLSLPIRSTAQSDSLVLHLQKYLEELALQDEDFSVSVAVAKQDKLVFSKAYGLANRNFQLKADTATLYNIASIGKLFTATAILQLIEKGELELDAPVSKYLPDISEQDTIGTCTIRQLLTHSSGLPLWFSLDFIKGPKHPYRVLKDYKPLLADAKVDQQKVGQFQYSNVGYFLLGFVLEAVTGTSYEALIQSAVFKKADMQRAEFYALDAIKHHAATGYNRPAGPDDYWKPNHYLNLSSNPAGGAYVSPTGLLQFIAALRNGQLLNPTTLTSMQSKQVDSPLGPYGFGMKIEDHNGYTFKGHDGAFFGARGVVGWWDDTDYSIAILSNTDQTDFIDVYYYLQTYLTASEEQRKAYEHTQATIYRLLNEHTTIEKLAIASQVSMDEDLIQIKAYHYWNKQDYSTAKRLFQLNARSFPQSERAKADLAKANKMLKLRN